MALERESPEEYDGARYNLAFAQLFLGVFYLDLTLLGAWSALYYAINFYVQVEEQNDQLIRLENQATQAQLAMLRYQLNPHFLFNALNAISSLIRIRPQQARQLIANLADYLRYNLNKGDELIDIQEELQQVRDYVAIEQARFGELIAGWPEDVVEQLRRLSASAWSEA